MKCPRPAGLAIESQAARSICFLSTTHFRGALPRHVARRWIGWAFSTDRRFDT